MHNSEEYIIVVRLKIANRNDNSKSGQRKIT